MDLNFNKICPQFQERGVSEYDPSYFPAPTEINKLTEQMWNISDGPIPSWLGFNGKKHGSYDLRNDGSIDRFNLTEVTEDQQIFCPYLERAFSLKKQHKKSLGFNCMEIIVYHASTPENLKSICIHNFNWRLFGRSTGNRHGQGVSFSPYIHFANKFCKSLYDKRMIEAKILCCNSIIGLPDLKIPPYGCDTTKSSNGNVLVKFDDSEFLPLRLIRYN